jgi:hypothetical protein
MDALTDDDPEDPFSEDLGKEARASCRPLVPVSQHGSPAPTEEDAGQRAGRFGLSVLLMRQRCLRGRLRMLDISEEKRPAVA